MATASNSSDRDKPDRGGGQLGTEPTVPAFRWTVIVPVVLIAAIILLVGLPLGAVLIMNSSGCCLANAEESAITFWSSMIAGFLTLFGMIVTGVFIITAFRVEATARAQAQIAARDEVWTYIKNYRKKLYNDLCALKSLVEEVRVKVEELGEKAKEEFAKAEDDVKARQKEANAAIVDARDATTNAASQAQEEVAEALEATTKAADAAQDAIGKAVQGVRDQHDEAIRAIDSARQEAEDAARAVRERADRPTDGPTPPQGDDPEETR